jgi:transcriptional regulator with XRE-family HTH domain
MVTLRELRRERGLSLEAVSLLSGLDVATVSRIERGLAEAWPTTVVKLAKGLGIRAKRMQEILEATDEAAIGV